MAQIREIYPGDNKVPLSYTLHFSQAIYFLTGLRDMFCIEVIAMIRCIH